MTLERALYGRPACAKGHGDCGEGCEYGMAGPCVHEASGLAVRAKVVAAILTDHGLAVTPPDEASLDDVEQARWDVCLQIAQALHDAMSRPVNKKLDTPDAQGSPVFE